MLNLLSLSLNFNINVIKYRNQHHLPCSIDKNHKIAITEEKNSNERERHLADFMLKKKS